MTLISKIFATTQLTFTEKLFSVLVQQCKYTSTQTGKDYVELDLLLCTLCFGMPSIKQIWENKPKKSEHLHNNKVTYSLWAIFSVTLRQDKHELQTRIMLNKS